MRSSNICCRCLGRNWHYREGPRERSTATAILAHGGRACVSPQARKRCAPKAPANRNRSQLGLHRLRERLHFKCNKESIATGAGPSTPLVPIQGYPHQSLPRWHIVASYFPAPPISSSPGQSTTDAHPPPTFELQGRPPPALLANRPLRPHALCVALHLEFNP